MEQYLDLQRKILEYGHEKSDRTNTGTLSIFGHQMRFDLQKGFPLLTTKKLSLKSIIYELLWFLSGDTNIGYLKDHGVSIWDEWADENGDLGPVYGHQWRSWPRYRIVGESSETGGIYSADIPIDQISNLVRDLKNNPDGRRQCLESS